MKHTILYIATLFLLAGCQQEELPLGEQALGYLSLSEVSMEASDVQLISTRASETDDLIIALTPADEGPATEYEYAETISCPPGTYTLEVYNKDYKEKAEAAHYYYKHDELVIIKEKETETVKAIQVPMINFGVTFSWPEDLKGFTEIKFKVEYNSISKEIQTGETAYFDISDKETISYTLSAKNEDEDEDPVATNGLYGDEENETLKAGTIYTVSYKLETQTLEIK